MRRRIEWREEGMLKVGSDGESGGRTDGGMEGRSIGNGNCKIYIASLQDRPVSCVNWMNGIDGQLLGERVNE